jgi:hypothetical protein
MWFWLHRGCRTDGRDGAGSGTALERPTGEGESPVSETGDILVGILSTTGHANPVGSWGDHSPRLNTLDDR